MQAIEVKTVSFVALRPERILRSSRLYSAACISDNFRLLQMTSHSELSTDLLFSRPYDWLSVSSPGHLELILFIPLSSSSYFKGFLQICLGMSFCKNPVLYTLPLVIYYRSGLLAEKLAKYWSLLLKLDGQSLIPYLAYFLQFPENTAFLTKFECFNS